MRARGGARVGQLLCKMPFQLEALSDIIAECTETKYFSCFVGVFVQELTSLSFGIVRDERIENADLCIMSLSLQRRFNRQTL